MSSIKTYVKAFLAVVSSKDEAESLLTIVQSANSAASEKSGIEKATAFLDVLESNASTISSDLVEIVNNIAGAFDYDASDIVEIIQEVCEAMSDEDDTDTATTETAAE